jgi:hypothetical protein
LAEGLRSRRAQVYLDLAWMQAQRKRDAEATLHLLEPNARPRKSSGTTRMVRDLLREMLAPARHPNGVLHDLSLRPGVRD